MRAGTGCFSKAIKPAEVDSFKEIQILTYRLLWLMVQKFVPPELVFQFDETGCSLLPFSKRGRAQRGCQEVKFFGMDDKRQFTLTPVINGLNKLVFPTQMTWAGTEYLKSGARGDRAQPSKSVQAEHAEYLQHEQTASQWCTIGSIQLLTIAIATHVASVVANNLDLAGESQYWIIVLDCYAVDIGEEFTTWCKTTYPYLILMCLHQLVTTARYLIQWCFQEHLANSCRHLASRACNRAAAARVGSNRGQVGSELVYTQEAILPMGCKCAQTDERAAVSD
jgi:hypothetical protein